MKTMDDDIAFAVNQTAEDADLCSRINGESDDATMEARRLEVAVKRLAREAGYDVDAG